jgi:hypothetical protein
LNKINFNAYVLDLLEDIGISNVFNIEDLTLYQRHDEDEPNDAIVAKLLLTPCLKEEIEDVIDHELLYTNGVIKCISSNGRGILFLIVL